MTPAHPFDRAADTTAPLHPLLAERWSPRGFDRSHHLDDDQLTTLLEAARWAPSAMNLQPWRFVVARRGSEPFTLIHDALMGFNQVGIAVHAGVGADVQTTVQAYLQGGLPVVGLEGACQH